MPSMDCVQHKVWRAKVLTDELMKELTSYYATDPGDIFTLPESKPGLAQFIFKEKEPIPARLGLIFGDAIQCLRSSLDYLVWELSTVVADEERRRLMFPICITEDEYKGAITKRKRLAGVSEEAVAIIDQFQPYRDQNPEGTVLAMLESLTNINKHRRVILTGFAGVRNALPVGVPHIIGETRVELENGEVIDRIPIWAALTIRDGFAKGIEVSNFIDVTARFLTNEFFPLFQKFLK